MLGDVSPSVCSPEQETPTQLVSAVAEEDVVAPVGSRSVLRQQPLSSAPSGILAVLLARRRWEYGQRTVVFSF